MSEQTYIRKRPRVTFSLAQSSIDKLNLLSNILHMPKGRIIDNILEVYIKGNVQDMIEEYDNK